MKKFSYLLPFFLLLHCFTHVPSKGMKNCERIMGTPGPEDISLDRESGILFISSHERRIPQTQGYIYTLDLKIDSKIPQKVETKYPEKFAPHGIHFASVNGIKKLYVISHPKLLGGDGHTIEIFRLEKELLIHESTIRDPKLLSPNDLFVTQTGKIFVSNDVPANSQFTQILHILFRLNSSPISYYDGSTWQLLNEKTAFGNGILLRKENDKEYLYRSSHVYETVYKYELNSDEKGNPKLKTIQKFELNSGPDNLEEDENGNIYVAAHKSNLRFMGHAGNKEKTSPSQVFQIKKDGSLDEIYANDGDEISAASTGLKYKNKFYISQVFEPFLLTCPVGE